MTLTTDFKARFPEFDASTVDQYLPTLEPVWPCYYGGNYDIKCDQEIILNLLAHLLVGETAASSASSRNVASKSVGSVSVGYAGLTKNTMGTDFFLTTKYGQRYLMLTSTRGGVVFA